MDKIIAMFSSKEIADRTRLRLFAEGFPGDRLDVVSWHDPGRIIEEPAHSREDNLIAHFATLIPDDGDVPILIKIIKALRDGKVAVVVLPRDKADVVRARGILASQRPEIHVWYAATTERQDALLGEHAAVQAASATARCQSRA